MRILVINWQDRAHPLAGGAEVHLHEVFGRLARKGHEITVLACRFPGAEPETVLDGMRIVRRGPRPIFNFFVPFVYRRELAQEPFDLVVEDLNKIPFYARFYARAPVVAILHHFFGTVIYQETNPLFGSYVYLTERSVPKLYRGIPFAVVSQGTKADLVRAGMPPETIRVIYNGVHERFRPGEEKSPFPLLVYLGRLKRYKRVDLALEVFQKVRRAFPKAQMWIIGEGDARPGLERLARRMGLASSVRFFGFVSEEEKVQALQKAWVLLNTSPKEGFGLVSVEAQACGTPAVVFDSPGLNETVVPGQTGFVVPFGDTEAMARRILDLFQNPALRERMSGAAARWGRSFSWDRTARETEAFLLEAIQRGRTFDPVPSR